MPDPLHLELFAVVPVETGERAVPVLNSTKLVAVEHDYEAVCRRAVAHAAVNCGDGDYVVKDELGRRVATVEVRLTVPHLTRQAPGPTPAEELATLFETCPLCESRMVLIPCGGCGARRCARCMAARYCCNPDNLPPVRL